MKLLLCLILAGLAFGQYPKGAAVMHPIASVWYDAPSDALSIARVQPLETVHAPFVQVAQNDAPPVTQPRASQIKEAPVAAASVRVVMPDGSVVYAQLDATTLVLDTTTKPPTLRARPAVVVSEFPKFYQLERNASLQFVVPPGTVYSVYRNGLLMFRDIDYTVVNGLLTFKDGHECCQPDEIVTATVYR